MTGGDSIRKDTSKESASPLSTARKRRTTINESLSSHQIEPDSTRGCLSDDFPSDSSESEYWSYARPRFIFTSRTNVFALFLLLDFLIYCDRGIVPGAHDEFGRFLMQNESIKKHPEVYFGLLQSVFIGGLGFAAPVLSYLAANSQMPVRYLAMGLSLWLVSIAGCSAAGFMNSVTLLFLFRTLSGVGEGAFTGLMAPVLLDACDDDFRGTFLGLFYGLMPTGVAVGFIASASLASRFHWRVTFLGLSALSALPIMCIILFSLSRASHGDSPLKHFARNPPPPVSPTSLDTAGCVEASPFRSPTARAVASDMSFLDCVHKLLQSPLFVALLLCGSAQAAVSSALSSFGTAFLLNLDVFQKELSASAAIGIVGAFAGAIGTFAGGFLLYLPERVSTTRLIKADRRIFNSANDETKWLIRTLTWPKEARREFVARLYRIRPITLLISIMAAVASVLMTLSPTLLSAFPTSQISIVCLSIGLLLVFMTQSGLNLSMMLTAPDTYRSLAISVFTLGLHLFGDVPGPILVGWLKDTLAPHCRPAAIRGAESGASAACRRERGGLLTTLSFFLAWTNLVWIGLGACHLLSRKAIGQLGRRSLVLTASEGV